MAPAERDPGEGDAAGVAATSVSLCVCQNRKHVKISSNDFVSVFIELYYPWQQRESGSVATCACVYGYEYRVVRGG